MSHLSKALGVLVALTVPAVAVAALTIPNTFNTGDTLSASALNQNFGAVRTEVNLLDTNINSVTSNVSALSAQLVALQTELTALRTKVDGRDNVAGYVTKGSATVPFYRKVLTATRSDVTMLIPHGISGNPALSGRVISCSVSVLNGSGGVNQAFSVAIAEGASAVQWCDIQGDNVQIRFVSSVARDFQVTLDYVAQW